MIGKAVVDTPAFLYMNVTVELVSDDDVNMTVTVRNRQGVLLETLTGEWTGREGDAWIVSLPDGVVAVSLQGGCGCGGSSVEPKIAADAAPGQGYLP